MRQLSTDLHRHEQQPPQNGLRRYRRPNLPVLFYSIIGRNWDAAVRRTISHPHEIFSVEDASGDSPLHYACRLDPPVEIIEALMPVCNEKNREGATALHVAASHRCSAGVIKIMVETEFVEVETSLTLSLTIRGRTPLHYACSSYRGLGFDAFRILLEATIEAYAGFEKRVNCSVDMNNDSNSTDDADWEDNTERANAFTMQDHLGYTPLSLLFKRYRERVKYVIRSMEKMSISTSVAAAERVQDELGGLWLKARLIVALMAEKRRDGKKLDVIVEMYEETRRKEDVVAREAARWAAQHHQMNGDDENDDDDNDLKGRTFKLVHASVSLVGYGCPIEMIRLAMSVYPNQVREMDSDGNLPLHIAAVASTFLFSQSQMKGSDEDSFESNLSSLSAASVCLSNPFRKVIRMLLKSFPEASRIPHGRSGHLPLILAINARQRTMDDGLKLLIDANPAALECKEFDPKLYPFMLSTLGKAGEVKITAKSRFPRFGRKKKEVIKKHVPITLFECLRARPNLLSNNDAGI